jgi:hypothetical protein
MEMSSGYEAAFHGENDLILIFATTFEKALEMLGVSLYSSARC